MAAKKNKKTTFRDLSPKYNFIINPYPDQRLTRCPWCDQKTGQRKLPLGIHIEPKQLISLNYTCRYCKNCDLLIAHKHEIEHHLCETFRILDPQKIGNDYTVLGTEEKKVWREGLKNPRFAVETLDQIHIFNNHHGELRCTQPGYYHKDVEPPILKPLPSKEWVKPDSAGNR